MRMDSPLGKLRRWWQIRPVAWRTCLAVGVGFIVLTAQLSSAATPSVVDEIRNESVRRSTDPTGRPLPLAGHWNMGNLAGGFSPSYQLELISAGHHILPWFQFPDYRNASVPDYTYYEAAIKQFAAWNLPISLVGTQWESILSDPGERFFSLPADQNPNVVDLSGQVLPKLDPLGPIGLWQTAGTMWTKSLLMQQLQTWYPSPPLILFLSNNEQPKLLWKEAETSRNFVRSYGIGTSDTFRRKVFGDAWIERYRALILGMRSTLASSTWQTRSVFIGYDSFGPSYFGRSGVWEDTLFTPGRISPWPYAWGGTSSSYYTNNWDPSTDYRVWSPQIESMNWVFMQHQVVRDVPEFWFEMSVWDGNGPASFQPTNKRTFYEQRGQQYGPERYEGLVQYGMWLLTPRIVREFRYWTEKVSDCGAYFDAILRGVDRVYADPILTKFWRTGTLVPNHTRLHPYQVDIPAEYTTEDRWFLLNTNLDPPGLWNLYTELPVMALARVIGQSNQREWLVYAHAPVGPRNQVQVEIPDYKKIVLDVPVAGAFYYVRESDGIVNRIAGGPSSLQPPTLLIK
ncbi:MAG: hypothetical protein KGS09_19665 [Nitrospirae bacterium]|nr:hypothetical protein [Nitrospirota bacterium]MDE3040391.1 hypothetical protein [Nitrospirota bacterium]